MKNFFNKISGSGREGSEQKPSRPGAPSKHLPVAHSYGLRQDETGQCVSISAATTARLDENALHLARVLLLPLPHAHDADRLVIRGIQHEEATPMWPPELLARELLQ